MMKERWRSTWEEIRFLATARPRTAYIGWNGHGNLGDEILYRACETLLGKELALYSKMYTGKGVKYILGKKVDCVLLGGGTLVHSKFFLERFHALHAPWQVVFGSGVQDPVFWNQFPGFQENMVAWRETLNQVDYLSVRGPLSQQVLRDNGVTTPIELIGDPALIFARKTVGPGPGKKILGVNVGATRNHVWGGDDTAVVRGLLPHLVRLGQAGWSFVFFPVCHGDLPLTEMVMEGLGGFPVSCVDNFLDARAFMEGLEGVDVFLGEKLHSVILAVCVQTPSIMLEYRPKCRDFMASMEMEDHCFRVDALEEVDLADRVAALFDRRGQIQGELAEKNDYYQSRLREAAANVIELCVFGGSRR